MRELLPRRCRGDARHPTPPQKGIDWALIIHARISNVQCVDMKNRSDLKGCSRHSPTLPWISGCSSIRVGEPSRADGLFFFFLLLLAKPIPAREDCPQQVTAPTA